MIGAEVYSNERATADGWRAVWLGLVVAAWAGTAGAQAQTPWAALTLATTNSSLQTEAETPLPAPPPAPTPGGIAPVVMLTSSGFSGALISEASLAAASNAPQASEPLGGGLIQLGALPPLTGYLSTNVYPQVFSGNRGTPESGTPWAVFAEVTAMDYDEDSNWDGYEFRYTITNNGTNGTYAINSITLPGGSAENAAWSYPNGWATNVMEHFTEFYNNTLETDGRTAVFTLSTLYTGVEVRDDISSYLNPRAGIISVVGVGGTP
jgi:hypothetical protein